MSTKSRTITEQADLSTFYVESNGNGEDQSSDGSSESESIIDFTELVDENEEDEEDEEYEGEYDEGHAAHVVEQPAVTPLPEHVLHLIAELIPPFVGYEVLLHYDRKHNILHIQVPQSITATWQVRKNVIQLLYSRVPLLREQLDKGALEISFTPGALALIKRHEYESDEEELSVRHKRASADLEESSASEEDEQSRGEENSVPRPKQHSDQPRDAEKSVHEDDEDKARDAESSKSHDDAESAHQGREKSRARRQIDEFLQDLESSDGAMHEEHVTVRSYNGPQPNYLENAILVKEKIAQYTEAWFSEKKPRDDYDTWLELQLGKLVANINGSLMRVEKQVSRTSSKLEGDYITAESLAQACDTYLQHLVHKRCQLENWLRLAALVEPPPRVEEDPDLPVSGKLMAPARTAAPVNGEIHEQNEIHEQSEVHEQNEESDHMEVDQGNEFNESASVAEEPINLEEVHEGDSAPSPPGNHNLPLDLELEIEQHHNKELHLWATEESALLQRMTKLSGPARVVAFVRALAAKPYLEGELLYLEQIHSPDTPTLNTVLTHMTELHRGTPMQHVPPKRARDLSASDEVVEVPPPKRHKSSHVREELTVQSRSAVAAMLGTYHARSREKKLATQLRAMSRTSPVVDTSGTVPCIINPSLPGDPVALTLQLSAVLKQHQIEGIQKAWHRLIEENSGCILAHHMGLGKTLTTLSFLDTVLRYARKYPALQSREHYSVLVIVPANALRHWYSEWDKWFKGNCQYKCQLVLSSEADVHKIVTWHQHDGLLLVSENVFKLLLDGCQIEGHEEHEDAESGDEAFMNNTIAVQDRRHKARQICAPLLLDPFILVIDEAHRVQNPNSKMTKILKKVKTFKRLLLTGSPVQNCLEELHTMVDFAVPNFWGTNTEFARDFSRAIMNGHRERATDPERNSGRIMTFLLHKEMQTFLQRVDESALAGQLPAKHSTVLWCRLSEAQKRILNEYHARVTQRTESTNSGEDLQLIEHVRYLSTHPAALEDKIHQLARIDLAHGPKLAVLFEIVRQCQRAREKLVVFSYDVPTYDLVRRLLQLHGVPALGFSGQVHTELREQQIKLFREASGFTCMVLTTRAGGLGINLVAARRCVLMNLSWNPADDKQATCRIHRLGQSMPTHVYYLLSYSGTDELCYKKQESKKLLADLTVDLKERNANTVDSYPLLQYFTPRPEPSEFTSHVSEEIARDPVMRHVLDTCQQYLVSVEELQEEINRLELDEQEQQDAELLIKAREQGLDLESVESPERRTRSRSKSRSRSRSRSRGRIAEQVAEESSEDNHSAHESESSVSQHLENIFRQLPLSGKDVERVALVRTVEGFPWWPVAVLKRQCYTRVREHVPSLVHKRGHQLVYFLGDEREDSVNFVVSHSVREMSMPHVREIKELQDRQSPYHDQLYFAFRQAAEVSRAVPHLHGTAEMLDLALEMDAVPDSTRNLI